VVKRGKTPVLTEEQARLLLESVKVVKTVSLPDGSKGEAPWLVGLRDRALIGVMTYTFARISAVVAMRVEDYFPNGKRWWLRLQEKGGKRHEMPAHHKLEQFLDEYLAAACIGDHDKTPLFRSASGRTGVLTERLMHRVDAYEMVRRRAAEASLKGKLGCHVFRATGITAYLEAGGTLENAQAMAAHESPRTTKLYDRTGEYGHRQPAGFTRKMLRAGKPIQQILLDWAATSGTMPGFEALAARGMPQYTGEWQVVKYADRFPPHVVARARAKLAQRGAIIIPQLLNSPRPSNRQGATPRIGERGKY
jgi:hypothetical protein